MEASRGLLAGAARDGKVLGTERAVAAGAKNQIAHLHFEADKCPGNPLKAPTDF